MRRPCTVFHPSDTDTSSVPNCSTCGYTQRWHENSVSDMLAILAAAEGRNQHLLKEALDELGAD